MFLAVSKPQDGSSRVACGQYRGGHTIAIGAEDDRLRANAQTVIVLPQGGPLLSPVLSVLPLQLLSYQINVARGYDADFTRNLSKTLTVD